MVVGGEKFQTRVKMVMVGKALSDIQLDTIISIAERSGLLPEHPHQQRPYR